MLALMFLAACGGSGRQLSPDSLPSIGDPPPADAASPNEGKLVETAGAGTGTDGGDNLLDGGELGPEENFPQYDVVEYYDPGSGQTIPVADDRIIIAVKEPPPPPTPTDPNFFDDESVPFYQGVYPQYPPVLGDPRVQQFLTDTGARPFTEWLSVRAFAVFLPDGVSVEDAVTDWPGEYDFIEEVEPDEVWYPAAWPQDPPNDYWGKSPPLHGAWHLWPPGTNGWYGIDVMGAWQSGVTGSSQVVVAQVDNGTQVYWRGTYYPDLYGRITEKGANVGDQKSSTDFQPVVKDVDAGGRGWDWVFDQSPAAAAWHGHGSLSAGVIVGQINNDDRQQGGYNDVAGICANVRLFPIALKVDGNGGSCDKVRINNALDVIGAVKRLYDPIQLYGLQKGLQCPRHNIEVAVLFCGICSGSETWKRHFWYLAGGFHPQWGSRQGSILFVSPAGNDSTTAYRYPAAYRALLGSNCTVLSIAAYESAGNRAWYSNYGPWVHLGAPTSVMSTDPLGTSKKRGYQLGWAGPGAYETYEFTGTCCSTAVTTGVAALVQSKYVTWTPLQVFNRMYSSVQPLPPAPELRGRIDCLRAVQ